MFHLRITMRCSIRLVPTLPGRVLEALIALRVCARTHPAVQRGVDYLLRTQEQDGSWYGRWGVNYIYGTFLALRGLRAAGLSENEPRYPARA